MELQDSIGSLPEELMQIIINYTSLQAIASIWMSSRYWRNKLKLVMEHPKILIMEHYGKISTVFMLKNGVGYDVRQAKYNVRHMHRRLRTHPEVKYGWFNNITTLKRFLSEFNQIMNDNTQIQEEDPDSFFVKIKPVDAEPTYYSMYGLSCHNIIDRKSVDRLNALIKNAEIVAPEQDKHVAEGISIHVIRHVISVWSDVFITPDGDIDLHTYSPNNIGIELRMRSSPEVFKQLEEVIVYSKHAKPVLELDEEYAKDHDICFSRVFDMKYTLNGKKYFIQECTLNSDPSTVKTNGYKNGSIKKIMGILEPVLFSKSIPIPLYEGVVTSAAPTFTGHQLIRLPRYKLPVDEDLTSILAVDLTVSDEVRLVDHTLNYHINVPLKEIVALFHEIEQNMNWKDTGSCSVAVKVGPKVTVKSVKVYCTKVFEPITKLPAPMLVKIWNMLLRSKK